MVFENKYTNTKKLLSEFYKVCVCKAYERMGLVLVFIGLIQLAVVILGMLGIFESGLSNKMRIVFLDIGLITIALGVLMRMYHKLMGRIAYKQWLKMDNGKKPETVITFNENIRVKEGKSILTYEYLHIKSLYETNNLYGLMIGKYSGILVDKNSFNKETLEEFNNFIKGKCTNAKFRCYTKKK